MKGEYGDVTSRTVTHTHLEFWQAGTFSPSDVQPRTPTRQRDAFLDLDEDPNATGSPPKRDPLRRGSSFSEAQMAAASMGLVRSSRAASTDDGSERGTPSALSESRERPGASSLLTLPDTPTKTPVKKQVVVDSAGFAEVGVDVSYCEAATKCGADSDFFMVSSIGAQSPFTTLTNAFKDAFSFD